LLYPPPCCFLIVIPELAVISEGDLRSASPGTPAPRAAAYNLVMADAPFSYTTTPGSKSGVTVLKITGPLTLTHLFTFQAAFREMKPSTLIMDLSDCRYMDSAGLGLIMNQFVSAANAKRGFIVTGTNNRIQSLMELTKVSTILRMYPTTAQAEASLQPLTRAI
jgi:anti-sigma B factor antagonist